MDQNRDNAGWLCYPWISVPQPGMASPTWDVVVILVYAAILGLRRIPVKGLLSRDTKNWNGCNSNIFNGCKE